MGTPDFAVPCLKKLIESEHKVAGVVTVPDKPAGRGRTLRMSAIKQAALENGLPVLQPEKMRDERFLKQLSAWNADLFVVVAFRILPDVVFTMPPKGAFNLHASLLPKYRGAAPINWALIKGEKESGLTTFFLDKTVDTGGILLQESTPLTDDMTAGELHDRLSRMGAELVLKTVNGIADSSLTPQKQVGDVTLAPKLTKELEQIDWTKSAKDIHNLVRGLSPYPGSSTMFRDKRLKVLRTTISESENSSFEPGQISHIGKNGPIEVQTGDGILSILEVKPEGKNAMTAGDFHRGARLQVGESFA